MVQFPVPLGVELERSVLRGGAGETGIEKKRRWECREGEKERRVIYQPLPGNPCDRCALLEKGKSSCSPSQPCCIGTHTRKLTINKRGKEEGENKHCVLDRPGGANRIGGR